MKSAFEKLESPYLGGELQFVIPPDGLSNKLAHAIAESPFANLLASVRGVETGESLHSAVKPAGFEALAATAAQPGKMLDEQLWAERSPAENEATEWPFESPSSFADVGESLGVPEDADESPANEAEAHEREALAFLEEGRESGDAFPEFEEQVFTLPPSLPSLPNDATLRGQLQAIGTAEARALDAAFAVFGDPARFSNRLPPALNAAFESLTGAPKQRFRVHVARLGAEAFIDSNFPPHLRYLKHNALLANISREHLDAVRASWATLHQRLEAAKDGRGNVLPARVIDEIRRHRASFEKANQAAKARLDKEREPLIKEINDDLAVNRQRVPKEVWIIETNPSVPFISAVEAYRKALEEVIRSRNLPAIDPREFFPEDDFVAAVE